VSVENQRLRSVSRFVRWITGAQEQEAGRVVLCFFALHFLLISYYLIKPLRNSQFLKEFDPDFLPVVSFGVVLVSLLVTKIFNYLADRVEKYRLVTGTYLTIISLKLVFGWLLIVGGKPAVVAFYFFASVYFLLAIATMWACTNDIFTPNQGERCYGFIAVGSTLGGILGSWVSKLLSQSELRAYAPAFSALSMGVALLLILAAAHRRRQERAKTIQLLPKERGEFWSDVAEVLRRPYVRRIGIMVVVLAMFNTSLDYISNRAIDRGVSQEQFFRLFSYLPASDYSTVYELKQKPEAEQTVVLQAIASKAGKSPVQVAGDYEAYRQGNETQTRSLFSDVYRFQGILGIVLLLIVARLIFARYGVRHAIVILPLLAALSVLAFAFPLALGAVEIIMVVVGAANYSLNNAAKELLYTASDEDTKFKYKPLIEGPGMRFGDVLAAVLALAIAHTATTVGWNEDTGQAILLAVLLTLIAVWTRAAFLAGREYDQERRLSAVKTES
jgi:AAA family ATP:ADP antiporter